MTGMDDARVEATHDLADARAERREAMFDTLDVWARRARRVDRWRKVGRVCGTLVFWLVAVGAVYGLMWVANWVLTGGGW